MAASSSSSSSAAARKFDSEGTSNSFPAPNLPLIHFYLVSSDRGKFFISTAAGSFSGVINKKLQQQDHKDKVVLDKHDRKTLRPVVKYLSFSEDGKPDEFFNGVNPTIGKLLAMVAAAEDLEIPGMVDAVCEKIADKMKNKSVEWVRAAFGIEGKGDLTKAEVAEIKVQYPWVFEGVVDEEDEPEDDDDADGYDDDDDDADDEDLDSLIDRMGWLRA